MKKFHIIYITIIAILTLSLTVSLLFIHRISPRPGEITFDSEFYRMVQKSVFEANRTSDNYDKECMTFQELSQNHSFKDPENLHSELMQVTYAEYVYKDGKPERVNYVTRYAIITYYDLGIKLQRHWYKLVDYVQADSAQSGEDFLKSNGFGLEIDIDEFDSIAQKQLKECDDLAA